MAIECQIRLIWDGFHVWGGPGLGWNIDAVDIKSWQGIVTAMNMKRVDLESWTKGMIYY